MKKIYSSIGYEIYGFCQSKSDLRYETENFPLVANVIHLAGNPFLRAKNACSYFYKNGLTGSAIQLTFKIKYRYCIGGSHCERPITG